MSSLLSSRLAAQRQRPVSTSGRTFACASHASHAAASADSPLHAVVATRESFAPYGTLLEAGEDGVPHGVTDARLVLDGGAPRFYLMRLPQRSMRASTITHHARVTQCLAAVGDAPWYLAVAPPGALRKDQVVAFQIKPPAAVALHVGTWHSGPYYSEPERLFYNLELADTNVVDHTTRSCGPFQILPPA